METSNRHGRAHSQTAHIVVKNFPSPLVFLYCLVFMANYGVSSFLVKGISCHIHILDFERVLSSKSSRPMDIVVIFYFTIFR